MRWRGTRWVIMAAAAALVPSVGLTHGSNVAATMTRQVSVELTVAVEATYHSGRPMAGAQVTVLAPGSPDEPWLKGECDAEGRFEFAPPLLPYGFALFVLGVAGLLGPRLRRGRLKHGGAA